MGILDSKVPSGPLADKWTKHKNEINLVNPANKRNIDIIIVGTGLAGASAAATLAELGYNVKTFCYQDSPRRAHSIAQGVPFAREYGGLLDNRSFGGVLVSRTFYAKGQTGQQLLLGAYAAMNRQIHRGKIKSYTRHEMLDVVLVDGRARWYWLRGDMETYFSSPPMPWEAM